jgi:hypothetical protein
LRFWFRATNSFEMWWPGTDLNRRCQPFQFTQPISLFGQLLNVSRWPRFCDHSVTSADVRLKRRSQSQPCCLPATRRSRQFQAGITDNHHTTPRLLRLPRQPVAIAITSYKPARSNTRLRFILRLKLKSKLSRVFRGSSDILACHSVFYLFTMRTSK